MFNKIVTIFSLLVLCCFVAFGLYDVFGNSEAKRATSNPENDMCLVELYGNVPNENYIRSGVPPVVCASFYVKKGTVFTFGELCAIISEAGYVYLNYTKEELENMEETINRRYILNQDYFVFR